MRNKISPVVLNLIIINVIFFIASEYILPKYNMNSGEILGIHYFDSNIFKPFQIFTSMFTHGGFFHLFFNLYFGLYMFGQIIENKMGSMNFLKFFLLCGLGATALHMGIQAIQVYNITGSIFNDITINSITYGQNGSINYNFNRAILSNAQAENIVGIYAQGALGASGAIYGLLIAFAMFFPDHKLMLIFLPVPIKARYFIPVMIGLDFYLGLANYSWDPIAHFAHLGGALFGFLLVKFWLKKRI